jgi:hypothetical protein
VTQSVEKSIWRGDKPIICIHLAGGAISSSRRDELIHFPGSVGIGDPDAEI